ncbi:chemotaxis protein CheD [bacterium]|nr:chemotaxis protein CheD [bacterium]
MVRKRKEGRWTHFILEPGEHYVSDMGVVISTLLGSCVSACLYDPVNRIMGMNHFLLASKRYAKEKPIYATNAGRYGIQAMELVINKMLRLGANRKYLKAKAFGGGNVLQTSEDEYNFFNVGEVNIRFIKEFLELEKVPLITSDLGGSLGRVIRFHGDDYSVYVRKIKRAAITDLIKQEKRYWKSNIDKQKEKTDIKLW